jgi:hypothetical protein
MFEKFRFSKRQIRKYYQSAIRDLKIASNSKIPEVIFRFSYDALVKLAIAVCAKNGLRVKARKGHHIELIKKLSFYLKDPEVEILANEMRSKRNRDLYDGGILISEKEAKEYLEWVKQTFQKTQILFENSRGQKAIF